MKWTIVMILVSMLLPVCVQAEPWAESVVVSDARRSEAMRGTNPSKYKSQEVSVLPRILAGQSVRVNIAAEWNLSDNMCNKLKERVRSAYNAWFQNAANTIRAQHREQEFKDVLPTLQRGVPLELNCVSGRQADASQTDVMVYYKTDVAQVRKECGKHALGCCAVGHDGSPMKVIVPFLGGTKDISPSLVDRTLVHELGHTLGLADTYQGAYEKDASKAFRSQNQTPYTIMSGATDLRADDADGLINMMDAWKIHNMRKKYRIRWDEHVSARILYGWGGLNRDARTGSSVERYKWGTTEKLWKDAMKQL